MVQVVFNPFDAQIQMTDITTLAGLQAMKGNLSGDYVLKNDIDASDTATWNGGLGFEPIGNSTNRFNGTFDGGNFTISGLTINRHTTDNIGLFGFVGLSSSPNKVVLKDVTLSNADINGKTNVGILVGYIQRILDITNVHTGGSVTASVADGGVAGGLAGRCGTTSRLISYCSSSADVIGKFCGGLIGIGTGAVHFSYSTGTVSCTYTGEVSSACVGGFIGLNSAFTLQCFSTAGVAVSGDVVAGGFIGMQASACHAVSCYAAGSITGDTSGYINGCVGGFFGTTDGGSPGYAHGCHSVGTVSGNSFVGGFVGYNYTMRVIQYINCFWDTDRTGQANGFDGQAIQSGTVLTGLTSAQMADISNFPVNTTDGSYVNWNTDEWIFCDYPLLIWHDPACPSPPVVPGQFWTRLKGATQTFS